MHDLSDSYSYAKQGGIQILRQLLNDSGELHLACMAVAQWIECTRLWVRVLLPSTCCALRQNT